jgi:hypothetical protein
MLPGIREILEEVSGPEPWYASILSRLKESAHARGYEFLSNAKEEW